MRLLLLLAVPLTLAACADDAPAADTSEADARPEAVAAADRGAQAILDGLNGSGVSGTVAFRETDGALTMRIALAGLTPGAHGFHVHEGDSCGPGEDGTPGGAAGGHFNPLVSEHGAPADAPSDRHAGDLGNITANEEGIVAGTVVDSVLTLSGPTSAIGRAVIVHADADDLTSQPSGAAGPRVACGIVEEAGPEADLL
ncbi:MAG: superoxide dismutase family protein [Bacteroidota bacterium]